MSTLWLIPSDHFFQPLTFFDGKGGAARRAMWAPLESSQELRQSLEDSSIYSLATSTVCALQLWWISGRRLPVPRRSRTVRRWEGEVAR